MSAPVRVVALVSGAVHGGVLTGRVEVVLKGPADAVRATVTALSGPGAPGTVRSVDSRAEVVQGMQGFTTA